MCCLRSVPVLWLCVELFLAVRSSTASRGGGGGPRAHHLNLKPEKQPRVNHLNPETLQSANPETLNPGPPPSQVDKVDQLKPIAEELGCTMPQLALAWCGANPNVSTVIMGASCSAWVGGWVAGWGGQELGWGAVRVGGGGWVVAWLCTVPCCAACVHQAA